MPRATSSPGGRVKDVQWQSRRGKEAGGHAGTCPSCYNEDWQCQGLGSCSLALVFQETECSSSSGPWGSVHHIPMPLVLSFTEAFCKASEPPFSGTLLSLMTLGHHAVLLFCYIFFITNGDVMFLSQQKVTPMLRWQQRKFLPGFWPDTPTK